VRAEGMCGAHSRDVLLYGIRLAAGHIGMIAYAALSGRCGVWCRAEILDRAFSPRFILASQYPGLRPGLG
jgi:hypothetical protein